MTHIRYLDTEPFQRPYSSTERDFYYLVTLFGAKNYFAKLKIGIGKLKIHEQNCVDV